MWKGKITLELKELARKYADEHHGCGPDEYDEIFYDTITYDEFVGYIQEALEKHCCIVDVIPD